MSIKDWQKDERPREKLIKLGPIYLADTELLAILILNGSSKKKLNAIDCARLLLKEYQDLRSLSNLTNTELCRIPGIGPSKASRIQAAMEIARRVASNRKEKGMVFNSSQDIFDTYSVALRDKKQEIFMVILLDSKNKFIREERISLGTLNRSIVHPREVYNPVIREAAAAVIFVHNHPSGDPQPSEEDILLTRRLVEAGNLLGIKVLDHIIVGEGVYYSFFDEKALA